MYKVEKKPRPYLFTLEDAFINEFPQYKRLFPTAYIQVYGKPYTRDPQTFWDDLCEAVGRGVASEIVGGYQPTWYQLQDDEPTQHYKLVREEDQQKASRMMKKALGVYTASCIHYRNQLNKWACFYLEYDLFTYSAK